MQNVRTKCTPDRAKAPLAVRAAFVVGCALVVCGCNTDRQVVAAVPETPTDYRMRHPITISEADRTLEIFVGANRDGLDPTQRAQVLAFAQTWRREATGGVVVDKPVQTANERAAASAMHEVSSILAASGVPQHGIVVRPYHPGPGKLATLRVTYPKITAQAGPCGLWPEDIGPTYNRDFFSNQPYWNLGCATQRNLAAMVDNPADLVEPRAETPGYPMRRTTVMEKYREGNPTATINLSNDTSKISTVGK